MTENNSTDLHMERAADQDKVNREPQPFSRWAALVETEKNRQKKRWKVKAEKHRGRER